MIFSVLFAALSIGQIQPVEIIASESRLIHINEASLDTVRKMIDGALPGSTVRLAYFILEDDYSTSALIELMNERAQKDGVKFEIMVDYIMSEAFLPWIEFLSTLEGFTIKRALPPTAQFKRYLRDDLGIEQVETFIRGLSLQKMDLIKIGIGSSRLLSPLSGKLMQATNFYEILQILMEPASGQAIQGLLAFESQFNEFSQRLHHKIMMAKTERGLEVIVEGRNWSDEYRTSLESEIGRIVLEKRAYPFFDASWYGVIEDAQSQDRMIQTFRDIWEAGGETSLPVVSTLSVTQLADRQFVLTERAEAFNVHWGEVMMSGSDRFSSAFIPQKPGTSLRYQQNLVTPGPNASGITEEWISNIKAAKAGETIVIISAYFYLSDAMKAVMTEAVKRGVLFEIYTNDYLTTDMNMVNIAAYQQFRSWIDAMGSGFRIFEMQPHLYGKGSLHAKIFYRKDKILGVGSANTDPRTELLDSNNMIFIPLSTAAGKKSAKKFVNHFLTGLRWREVTQPIVDASLAEWSRSRPTVFKVVGCKGMAAQL